MKESSYEPVVISSEDPNQNISLQDVALSESDSSDTDIDSIVEEYNDKIRVRICKELLVSNNINSNSLSKYYKCAIVNHN